MIKTVLFTIGALLAIYALCEWLHTLYLRFLITPKGRKHYTLLFLKEQTVEEQLHYAALMRKWNGNRFAERLLLCYERLSDGQLEECARVCEENGFCLCKAEELHKFLH